MSYGKIFVSWMLRDGTKVRIALTDTKVDLGLSGILLKCVRDT